VASELASDAAGEGGGGEGGEDHLHQLRVGLRRLRSALRFFDGWTTPVDPDWPQALTQLFRQLGVARDRDALAASLLPALREAGAPLFELPPAPPGPTPRELLRLPESTQTLLTGLALQIGAPVAGDAPAPLTARRTVADASSSVIDDGRALPKAAARRLALWHRRIVRAAKRYDDLSDDARHRLRRRVKRLRYASEFTASLYRPKAVARYLARLAPLQESLGRYNDLCVGLETYRAAVGDDSRAWFAIGWLVARRDVLLRQSEKALVRFAASEPFWEPAKGRAKRRAKHRTKDRAKHGPKLRDKHRDKHRPKAGRGAKKRSG
jgi:CHAD domain-containing protein